MVPNCRPSQRCGPVEAASSWYFAHRCRLAIRKGRVQAAHPLPGDQSRRPGITVTVTVRPSTSTFRTTSGIDGMRTSPRAPRTT